MLIINHLLLNIYIYIYIYIFSYIKAFIIFAHFGEKDAQSSNFFSIFVINEVFQVFKFFFYQKRPLLDTTILLISVFLIEIDPICWWNFCFWILISPNFIIVFTSFIYAFKSFYIFLIYNFALFYNVPLFSIKSVFSNKFIASFLLFKLIIWQ